MATTVLLPGEDVLQGLGLVGEEALDAALFVDGDDLGRQLRGKIDELAAEGVDLDQAQIGLDVVAQLEQVLQRLLDLDVLVAVHGRKIAQTAGRVN